MTAEKYYDKIVETCLDIGEKRISKLQEHQRLLELYGLTGLRTKHFFNALLSSGKNTLLELGVYRGGLLTCALYNNPDAKAYGVDDWRYSPIDNPAIKYDKNNKTIPWPNVKLAAIDNLTKFTSGNYKLIEKNWLELKKSDIPEPVDIVHMQVIPGATKEEIVSYLNAVYPLAEVTFILVMELHTLDDVKNAVTEWCTLKKITINSKHVKESGSLSETDKWYGGLGVYVLTKQEITK